MEAVVVVAVIAALLLILGVSLTSVAAGIMVILIAALGGMLILFAVCGILLAVSKSEDAVLDGFEKPHGYDTAVYLCGEERITNIFPAEGVLRDLIYKKKECRVYVCRLKKRSIAIDRHSAVIIIAGIALSLPSLIAVVIEFVSMF